MNEKIRELAEQSGFFPVPDETEVDLEYRAENARYERFAELIVRECLGIVNDAERGGDNEIWDNAVKFIIRDLKEHFGVEE